MYVSPKNKTAASHMVQIHICMHVFHGVKNGQLIMYLYAIPKGKALASQLSIFRENRLKFQPSSAAEKVSIICGTNKHVDM